MGVPERWQKPKSLTRFAHWVPLPDREREGMDIWLYLCVGLTSAGASEDEEDGDFRAIEHGLLLCGGLDMALLVV